MAKQTGLPGAHDRQALKLKSELSTQPRRSAPVLLSPVAGEPQSRDLRHFLISRPGGIKSSHWQASAASQGDAPAPPAAQIAGRAQRPGPGVCPGHRQPSPAEDQTATGVLKTFRHGRRRCLSPGVWLILGWKASAASCDPPGPRASCARQAPAPVWARGDLHQPP